MKNEGVNAVVIDNGSWRIRAGYSGDDAARVQILPIVGQSYDDVATQYVGDEAQYRRETLAIINPIQRGIIVDWDSMESVWYHVLHQELRVVPDQTAVLLATKYTDSRTDQERMTEVIFEKIGIQAFQNEMQAVLSVYATGDGVTTSLSIDSGDGATVIVPIYQGFAISHAQCKFPVAGMDISDHIENLLLQQGQLDTDNRDLIWKFKQTNCHLHSASEINGSMATFRLPDGKLLSLGDQIPHAPEALFKPSLLGLAARGIHEAAHDAIQRCDPDLQRMMYNNIVPSGGNTGFMNFIPRLETEIKSLTTGDTKVKVLSSGGSVERKHQVFVGGSILTSLSSFERAWCSRAEYEEWGAGVMQRKWKS